MEALSQPAIDRLARSRGRWLFLAVLLIYMLTSPGNLTSDTDIRWQMARSIAGHGWFDIPASSTLMPVQGPDGRTYCMYGLGQPICLTPFVWAGQLIGRVGHLDGDMVGQFLASMILFPVIGALCVWLLYRVALEAGASVRASLWLAGLYALGTMHWQNSVNTYEETQIALCLLVCVWALQRYWNCETAETKTTIKGETPSPHKTPSPLKYLLIMFAAMGAGLMFRVSSAVLFFAVGVVGIVMDLARPGMATSRPGRFARWVVCALVVMVPVLAGLGWYNYARFGKATETGYGPVLAMMGVSYFDTPFWQGLGGLLVSPGKGVLLFVPILIAALAGLPKFWRTHRRLAVLSMAVSAASVLFHAKYTFWSGDFAWGPRYLASIMPLAILPILPLLERARISRWVIAVAAVSVVIQLASVTYSFGLEFLQDRRHGTIPDSYVWRAEESQLINRFKNIGLHLAGRPNYESIPPLEERRLTCQTKVSSQQVAAVYVVNFFPFKVLGSPAQRRLFPVLLSLWLAMLAATGGLIFAAIRTSRRQRKAIA